PRQLHSLHRDLDRPTSVRSAQDRWTEQVLYVAELETSADAQRARDIHRHSRPVSPVVDDDRRAARLVFVRSHEHARRRRPRTRMSRLSPRGMPRRRLRPVVPGKYSRLLSALMCSVRTSPPISRLAFCGPSREIAPVLKAVLPRTWTLLRNGCRLPAYTWIP